MNQPVEGVDARTDRVAQSVVGLVLLAAFVFRIVWAVPVLAIVVGIAALGGPTANGIHRVFDRWIAPRIPASASPAVGVRVPAEVVRAQDALAAVILVVGSLALGLGIGFVGWAVTLVEAVIAIVAATTGVHLAERVRRRL